MTTINVPTREEVNSTNQEIFDQLKDAVGFTPNLLATLGHSDNGLNNFLSFSNAPSSLKAKEKEAVNLAVSQVNNCSYCLAAHSATSKMNGFTDDQILELRSGKASFDNKLDALARLAKNMTENRGETDDATKENFFAAGWTKENLMDAILLVGERTTTNYLHRTTKVPVDFPEALELAEATA